jgi:hypothetical protein
MLEIILTKAKKHRSFWSLLRIRIGFNADPDPAYFVNADPDPGFEQKFDKINS